MPDVMHLVKVEKPPARVYRALTTAEGIRHWWTRPEELERQRRSSETGRMTDGPDLA